MSNAMKKLNEGAHLLFSSKELYDDMQVIMGKLLAQMRKELYMTQAGLGERMHCSQSSISRLEKGEAFRDMQLLIRLCQYHGLLLGDFYNAGLAYLVRKKAKKPDWCPRQSAHEGGLCTAQTPELKPPTS